MYYDEETTDRPQMEMSNVLLKRKRGFKYKRQRKAVEIFQNKDG